jgi:hypothetical protein
MNERNGREEDWEGIDERNRTEEERKSRRV